MKNKTKKDVTTNEPGTTPRMGGEGKQNGSQ